MLPWGRSSRTPFTPDLSLYVIYIQEKRTYDTSYKNQQYLFFPLDDQKLETTTGL